MKNIDLLEATFRAWILAGVPTKDIVIALHNACVHGNVMTEAGENVTDANLEQLFAGFDSCIEAAKSMA
ncbi:MAG: hypothetical protein MN733_27645 [Nitrososphaera sp.]|nr:hypothetical protein [Nitrososphaera sp.]